MYVLNDRTKYESAIYTNEVERTLLTYINDALINGSYIKSLSYNAEIFDTNKISLGSALVDEIKVSINSEGIPNLNDINEFYFEEKITYGDGTEDTIPIGYFYSLPNNVDTSSKDFVKFTLKSKMELLKEPFKVSELISEESTLTREGLVEAICNKYDLYLASENFINKDVVIGNYDDNVYATSYLTMISERAGGFAYIGRTKVNDKLPLYIKSLNETDKVTIPNQTLGEYETKEKVIISKVSYTNGVDLFEQGDDTGLTIYLSSNSIFTCTEEEVLNIYNSLKGLSFQSLVVKIWGDTTIDKGDLITIGDLTTFAQMSWEYQRGFIGSYRTKLEKSTSSMEVSKVSATEERRLIRTEINEVAGSMKIISEKVETTETMVTEQNAQLELMDNEIKTSVSNLTTIIDNQNVEIIEKLDNYATNEEVNSIKKQVETSLTDSQYAISITKELQANGVSKVSTSTGYTFDDDGLKIEKTNADSSTLVNEKGINTTNTKNNSDILYAGYVDGTKTLSEINGEHNPNYNSKLVPYKGQSVVYSQNQIVDKYLVVGSHSRFEDYEDGTGCFYLG